MVTLSLCSKYNAQLLPQLRQLPRGARVVSRMVAVHGCRYTAWARKARMDATGLSRGGSRSPLQTGRKHYSWPSVAW
ncbi:MAG: hypothetical protein ACQESR_22260, partial [Planctomycetota bacterium]